MKDRSPVIFNHLAICDFKYFYLKYSKKFTSDNGKEFSNFSELDKKFGVKFYFSSPYHLWER